MRLRIIILVLLVMWMASPGSASARIKQADTYRTWVQAMKSDPKGPFERIRWYCRDGSVHPPQAYACRERGGGVQHGEWTDQVRQMRADGYRVATVLADLVPETFVRRSGFDAALKQIILERFLILADDGWIYRKARYYRGALQVEDETAAGRRLLDRLAGLPRWRSDNFILLREAARALPHDRSNSGLTELRQLSRAIEEKDPGFHRLRVKIHVQPDAADAGLVHRYRAEQGLSDLSGEYIRLADLIDNAYRPRKISPELLKLARRMGDTPVSRQLRRQAPVFDHPDHPRLKIAAAADLLASLRIAMTAETTVADPVALLDASLLLEDHLFGQFDKVQSTAVHVTRLEQLHWLGVLSDALYGTGLISSRQRLALKESMDTVTGDATSLNAYRHALRYQALGARWAERTLHFHFSSAMVHMGDIEPLAHLYVQDRLHSSPLLLYSAILDRLQEDADDLAGLGHRLFDASIVQGLQVLNPGLARGELHLIRPDDPMDDANPQGIYVLPETIAELPPVSGILTAGQGNILSHVQLLARNLGIPNVVAASELLPSLRQKEGRRVVLAASPQGVVHLAEDGPLWDQYFQAADSPSPMSIAPDLAKLDLDFRDIVSLENLRAADSGRIAGPKAANLAELKQLFPQAVTEGIVIPFGEFRGLLDRPLYGGGPTMFEWMQRQYDYLDRLENGSALKQLETRKFLASVRVWIETTDPGAVFRRRLGEALEAVLGPDGRYGAFVRSDTNVEDLPGFTGAGLNLTVPHVVGTENIIQAVIRVWASPFTYRAYSWRQAYMQQPQHVYASVLILKSVPVEKSGVLVTVDPDDGRDDTLAVAVNEGIGGAVAGQSAEELRIDMASGRIRLIAQASEPFKRKLNNGGGLEKVPASGTERVLQSQEIRRLVAFARNLGLRMPELISPSGGLRPTDVEFGFINQQLVLFQIRPYVDSPQTRRHQFLAQMDQPLEIHGGQSVDLTAIPNSR